jgi:hypothetical protein
MSSVPDFIKMAVAAIDVRMFWRTALNLRTLKRITPKIEKCINWGDNIIITMYYSILTVNLGYTTGCVTLKLSNLKLIFLIYRVSIKSFPDYKHLLQENYVEYKLFFFQNVTQEVFFTTH